MTRPHRDITEVLAAHQRLMRTVDGLDDEAMVGPSLLPDWDIAMVLTHLARHADGQVRGIEAAIAGGVRARYDSVDERDRDIQARRGASAVSVREDLESAVERLEGAYRSIPDDVWASGATSRLPGVDPEPLVILPFQRWREVEVHHADLGTGDYTPSDWPHALAERWLPEVLATLPGRADASQLLAWALGRTDAAPQLAPWR